MLKRKIKCQSNYGYWYFYTRFLGWIFFSPIFGLGTVALSGVFLYLSFGLINWKEINRNTNWGVILLFGSAISLGIQMKETGAAFWVAGQTLTYLEIIFQDVEIVRWFVSVIVTGLLTNLLSSAATVAVLGPIVLDMGGNPVITGFMTSIASAFAYLTVVASPTCMIIHSTGLITASDYFKADEIVYNISFFTFNSLIILLAFFVIMKILIGISSKKYSEPTLDVGMRIASILNSSTTILDVGEKINEFSYKDVSIANELMESWDLDRPGVDVLEWAYNYLQKENYITKSSNDSGFSKNLW